MSFLDKMNVNSGGLLNYDQLMKAQEGTPEPDKQEGDTPEKVEPDKSLEPNKGIVPFNFQDDTTTDSQDSDPKDTVDTGDKPTNSENKDFYKASLKAQADFLGIELDLENFDGGAKEYHQMMHDIYSNLMDEELEETKNTFFTPFQKRVLDMMQSGVPEDDAIAFFTDVNKIESIDLEEMDDKTARDAYKVYLKKTTKFTDTRINEEIEELAELGSLKDKVKKVIPDLKATLKDEERAKSEAAKQQEQLKKDKELQAQRELQEYLDGIEEIGGIKLNKKMKDSFKKQYQLVPNDKGQLVTPLQLKQSKDPVGFNAVINLLDSMGVINWDGRRKQYNVDFKALKAISKSEVFDQVESAINKQRSKEASNGGKTLEDIGYSPEKEDYMKKLLEVSKGYSNPSK
jgi:hypothetical protein